MQNYSIHGRASMSLKTFQKWAKEIKLTVVKWQRTDSCNLYITVFSFLCDGSRSGRRN